MTKRNVFSGADADGSELRLVNLITKQVMPTDVESGVLGMEARGKKALKAFVDDRISGTMNMWDKMPKLKFLSWKDGCKNIKLKSTSDVMNLKATNSLFVRLLLIAKSSRELELEDIVCKHEFSHYNATLMKRDGSLLDSTSKSLLTHELESMTAAASVSEAPDVMMEEPIGPSVQPLERSGLDTTSGQSISIVIDGMAIVHELTVHKGQIDNCQSLASFFVRALDNKSGGYSEAYVLFDD